MKWLVFSGLLCSFFATVPHVGYANATCGSLFSSQRSKAQVYYNYLLIRESSGGTQRDLMAISHFTSGHPQIAMSILKNKFPNLSEKDLTVHVQKWQMDKQITIDGQTIEVLGAGEIEASESISTRKELAKNILRINTMSGRFRGTNPELIEKVLRELNFMSESTRVQGFNENPGLEGSNHFEPRLAALEIKIRKKNYQNNVTKEEGIKHAIGNAIMPFVMGMSLVIEYGDKIKLPQFQEYFSELVLEASKSFMNELRPEAEGKDILKKLPLFFFEATRKTLSKEDIIQLKSFLNDLNNFFENSRNETARIFSVN